MILTNSQYQQLMSKYYDRQLKTKDIMEQRYHEVVNAIPELKDLDEKIRSLSLQHAKSRLTSGIDGEDLASTIAQISAEKERLLIAHGYPSDYLKPVYTCADCQDTGYIDGQKCHCFEKEIVNFLYAQSNLKDILENENEYEFIYLMANITLSSGIKINEKKDKVVIDGTYNNIRYTLTGITSTEAQIRLWHLL